MHACTHAHARLIAHLHRRADALTHMLVITNQIVELYSPFFPTG